MLGIEFSFCFLGICFSLCFRVCLCLGFGLFFGFGLFICILVNLIVRNFNLRLNFRFFENIDCIYARYTLFTFLTSEYAYKPRSSTTTNVGAIEYDADCMPVSSETIQLSTANLVVYPNPCYSCSSFFVRNLPEDNQYTYDIFSSMSTLITSGKIDDHQIILNTNLPSGIYFVIIHGDGVRAVRRIVVL